MNIPSNRMETRRKMREAATAPTVWRGPDVDFNPASCPNCGSTINHVVKTFAAIPTSDGAVVHRHHDCRNCKTRFRSLQRVPACDAPHYRTDG